MAVAPLFDGWLRVDLRGLHFNFSRSGNDEMNRAKMVSLVYSKNPSTQDL